MAQNESTTDHNLSVFGLFRETNYQIPRLLEGFDNLFYRNSLKIDKVVIFAALILSP